MRFHPRLARTLILRGVLAWLAARIFANIVLAFAASFQASAVLAVSVPGLEMIPWVLAFVAAFLYVDMLRRHESIFWRNLGFHPVVVVAVAMVPGGLIEAGLAMA